MRQLFSVALAVVALALSVPAGALALPAPAGVQQGHALQAAQQTAKKKSAAPCHTGIPVIGGAISKICSVGEEAADAVGGVVGGVAKVAGEGIMSLLAKWMIAAATTITAFVAAQMRDTTTPNLDSAWFEAQFRSMADLGVALGLLVALIALASAAIRRSPEALAATLAGIVRAGLGTALAVALTVIALDVADQISSAVLGSSTQNFWNTVSHAWSTSGFGGFGSSALAMLIATVEVLAALFVWLELIARDAAIYLAVLFVPVILAASIWPALGSWIGRLARLLLVVIALKPVALIVLSFAGAAGAAGLSFSEGLSASVGTILVATVIFCLAAFAPWALMYLLAADAESAHTAAGLRAAAGSAVTGSSGRSLRTAGGLRNTSGQSGNRGQGNTTATGSRFTTATGNHGGNDGGGPNGSGPGGDGAPAGGGGPSQGPDSPGGSSETGGEDDGSLAIGAETVGAGSVGAAAGIAAPDSSESEPIPATGAQTEHRGGAQTEQTPAAGSPDAQPTARQAAQAGSPTSRPHPNTGAAQRPGDAAGNTGTDAAAQDEETGGAPAGDPAPAATPPDRGARQAPATGDPAERHGNREDLGRSEPRRDARRLRLVAVDGQPAEQTDREDTER